MGWDVSSGPGVTALGLAAARSVEGGRPDRLVEDPFARALFEAAGEELPMLLDWPRDGEPVSEAQALHLHGSRYIGLRTRFYDDEIAAAVAGGVGQVVVLGAGLDTRAFRLGLPSAVRLYELDQPGVLAFKEGVLGAEPTCARRAIGADLREDWAPALLEAGFEVGRPAAWVAEGLLPYLEPRAQSALFATADRLAATGSTLAADRIAGDPGQGGRARELSERSGIDMESLFAGGEAGDLAAGLRDRGWEVAERRTAELAERYGRDLSDPFHAAAGAGEPPWLDTVFMTAAR